MITVEQSKVLRFFFNDTATTEIYTLSLHDALPISRRRAARAVHGDRPELRLVRHDVLRGVAARLARRGRRALHRSEEHTSELSHANISYAVFCLKKKNRDRGPSMMYHHHSPPRRNT